MIAFAKAQTGQTADAEDLVQETFIGFLRSLENYRGESKLESWLFRILRRRIIDSFRSKGSCREVSACSFQDDGQSSGSFDPIEATADPHFSPSVYARHREQRADDDRALSMALHRVIDRIKQESNLRDLMIMEGLFYGGIGNRELSRLIDVSEGQIAVVRHRLLKRIRRLVAESDPGETQRQSTLPCSDLLTEIWERDRPSCPKRTTLGKSLIGILDDSWQRYVTFHVDTLGCNYCRANREDLSQDDQTDQDSARCSRIFQSTIGFISRP
jgi:RNA polymerase sigma factor (sigma-70 family)